MSYKKDFLRLKRKVKLAKTHKSLKMIEKVAKRRLFKINNYEDKKKAFYLYKDLVEQIKIASRKLR